MLFLYLYFFFFSVNFGIERKHHDRFYNCTGWTRHRGRVVKPRESAPDFYLFSFPLCSFRQECKMKLVAPLALATL